MHIQRERRCVACRQPKQQCELLRVARVNGEYLLDTRHKLGGRGAYVCKTQECIDKTIKKRMLNRAYKSNLPDNIYKELEDYGKNN